MARADLVIATGGQPMVRAAYSSGTPAYGVGAGNSTMIIDETANIEEAARNTRCRRRRTSARAARPTATSIIEAVDLRPDAGAAAEGRRLSRDRLGEGGAAARRCGTTKAIASPDTVAIAPQQLAQDRRASTIPADRKFIIVHGDGIGKEHPISSEKLTTLLAVYKYRASTRRSR